MRMRRTGPEPAGAYGHPHGGTYTLGVGCNRSHPPRPKHPRPSRRPKHSEQGARARMTPAVIYRGNFTAVITGNFTGNTAGHFSVPGNGRSAHDSTSAGQGRARELSGPCLLKNDRVSLLQLRPYLPCLNSNCESASSRMCDGRAIAARLCVSCLLLRSSACSQVAPV